MTIRAGVPATAEDVAAVATQAASAVTAASSALANASSALANSVSAQAVAAAAQAAAAVALVVPSLPVVTSVASGNLVPIGQGGSTVAVSLGNLIGGQTAAQLQGASAAADTDTFPVNQGSGVLTAQTLGAVWTWVSGHLPGFKRPILEVSVSRTLDATYNGLVLVVTGAGVVLTPNVSLMGAGFACEIVTAGSGSVVWGAGVTATNGGTGLSAPNQYARLMVVTSSVGNLVLACVGAATSGSGVAAPGAVSGLTLGTVTSSSLTFSWTAPTTGGAATYYQVQYRIFGSGAAWTPVSPNPTAAGVTITGLVASTQYDVEVAANNTGGVASAFVVYGQSPAATTVAGTVYAPNVPGSLASGSVTASTITWTWAAAAVDGSHSAATGYYVETSTDNATWSGATTLGNVLTYTASSLTASTTYYLRVSAFNGTGASAYSSGVSGTTSAASGGPFNASGYLITAGVVGGTPSGTIARSAGTVAVNVNDNSVVSGSYTVPHSVSFAWGSTNTNYPTSGLQAAAGSSTGIGGANGENLWYLYMNPPSAAGTYYLWALAYNSAGTLVAAFVEANSVVFT